MTLSDLITKAKIIGNQGAAFDFTLSRNGLAVDFDFEITGNNLEGWHVEMVNYVEKGASPKMDKAKRFSQIVRLAEKVTGYSCYKTRCFECTFVRGLISKQLYKDGFSYPEIGRFLKVHHSTVMFYVKRLNEMLSVPSAFKNEVELYEKFQESVNDTYV